MLPALFVNKFRILWVVAKIYKNETKTYHFAVIGVKELIDQGEIIATETALQLHHMTENPRLVLQEKKKSRR